MNSFSCPKVVASTVWHVLKLSALRVARIWVAPAEEILVKKADRSCRKLDWGRGWAWQAGQAGQWLEQQGAAGWGGRKDRKEREWWCVGRTRFALNVRRTGTRGGEG